MYKCLELFCRRPKKMKNTFLKFKIKYITVHKCTSDIPFGTIITCVVRKNGLKFELKYSRSCRH